MLRLKNIESDSFLKSLSLECSSYLYYLLNRNKSFAKKRLDFNELHRTVVHRNPHIDEYCADLIFRSVLPLNKKSIEFKELSIFSEDNDSTCKKYFPNAAVFGIGRAVSGGVQSKILFDEHLNDGKRLAASCTDLVLKKVLNKNRVPKSILKVINEINLIDSYGKAHPYHIGNIIKTLHNVVFYHNNEPIKRNHVRTKLTDEWKKALIDACLVSLIYCEEKKINYWSDYKTNKKHLLPSLENYVKNTYLRNLSGFRLAKQKIKNDVFNFKKIFGEAKLKDGSFQNLILGKLCLTLGVCWGERIRDIVMLHLWEAIFQNQISFLKVVEQAEKLINNYCLSSYNYSDEKDVGQLLLQKMKKDNHEIYIFEIRPSLTICMPHRGLLYAVNKIQKENVSALVLQIDNMGCTKAIFKTNGFPNNLWDKIKLNLKDKEPECWHIVEGATFLLNGTKAHQYVPFSEIEIDDVLEFLA